MPALGIGCAAAPWLVPRAGSALAILFVAVFAPVARRLGDRVLVVALLALALVALAFQVVRLAGGSVTPNEARAAVSITALAVAATGWWRRESVVPSVSWGEGAAGAMGAGVFLLLFYPFLGRSPGEILSGLYLGGWDNQHHFAMLQHTVELGTVTWATPDGMPSRFLGYPSLHEQIWSIATWLSYPDMSAVDRLDLLHLYVLWSSLTFAACVAALAWVAGDVAWRLTGRGSGAARVIAILATGLTAALSGLTFLWNFGFTNYFLALTVVVTTSYLSARDARSVLRHGWITVLAGSLVVIQLWAPLLLALLPAWAVVIAVLATRSRPRLIAMVSILAIGAIAGRSMIAVAIEGLSLSSLAGMGGGMAPFNITAAVFVPLGLLVLWPVFWRRGGKLLSASLVPGAAVLLGFAGLMARAADELGVSRFSSYYTLKVLYGALIVGAIPLLALAGAALGERVSRSRPGWARRYVVVAACAVIGIAASLFGYVGAAAASLPAGFSAAPGVAAFAARWNGVTKITEGQLTLAAAAKVGTDDRLPIMWDGGDLLHNRWLRTLTAMLTVSDDSVYSALPGPPYDQPAIDELRRVLEQNPTLAVRILWLRDTSYAALTSLVERFGSRVELVRYG